MTTESIDAARPTCKTCRYWYHSGEQPRQIAAPGHRTQPLEDDPQIIEFHARKGQCRKSPPRGDRGFPMAFADQWCGQYKA